MNTNRESLDQPEYTCPCGTRPTLVTMCLPERPELITFRIECGLCGLVLIAFATLSSRRTSVHNARKAARERKQWKAEDEAARAATQGIVSLRLTPVPCSDAVPRIPLQLTLSVNGPPPALIDGIPLLRFTHKPGRIFSLRLNLKFIFPRLSLGRTSAFSPC
jgi:hypothetical protein